MRKLLIPIVLVIIGVIFASVYVVEAGSRGVVLRFNKIIGLSEPGLHFKIPGMDSVKMVDAKIQTTNSSGNNSKEQKFFNIEKRELIVDYFVQWKIVDFYRYYETIAGGNNVEELLLARVNGRLRAEFGKLNNEEIINDSNADTKSRNALMVRVKDELNGTKQEKPVNNTLPVESVPIAEINPEKITSVRDIGVEIIDVRIKKINFPAEISGAIYARMRSEREVMARNERFNGVRESEEIKANAILEATKILSEAERQSRVTRGEGDANAAKLYADAFNKDREFFSFIRSLKAYEQSFNSNDVMVISPDSEFFRYMKLDSHNSNQSKE